MRVTPDLRPTCTRNASFAAAFSMAQNAHLLNRLNTDLQALQDYNKLYGAKTCGGLSGRRVHAAESNM